MLPLFAPEEPEASLPVLMQKHRFYEKLAFQKNDEKCCSFEKVFGTENEKAPLNKQRSKLIAQRSIYVCYSSSAIAARFCAMRCNFKESF